MRTTYTLQEFYNNIFRIAQSAGKKYISVVVEMENNNKLTFKAYIEDYGYQLGATMEEVITKHMDAITGATKNIDVEIHLLTQQKLS